MRTQVPNIVGITCAYTLLLLCLVSSQRVHAQSDTQKNETDRLMAEAVGRQALKAAIEGLSDPSINPDFLADAILLDAGEHRKKDDSRRIIRDDLERALRNELLSQIKRIPSEVNKDKFWISPEWINSEYNRMSEDVERRLEEYFGKPFQRLFESARSKAIEKQWTENWTKAINPTEEQVERIYENPSKKSQIEERLRATVSANLLEENEGKLGEEIRFRIASGLEQLKGQSAVLNRSNAPGAFARSRIIATLKEELEGYRLGRKTALPTGYAIYQIFPSVINMLPAKAEAIMTSNLLTHISELKMCSFIDREQLKSTLMKDPQTHRKLDRSFSEISSKYRKLAEDFVAKSYKDFVVEQSGEDVSGDLKTLMEERQVASEVGKALSSCLLSMLRVIRSSVADQQMAEYFSDIHSGGWIPNEDKLVRHYNDAPDSYAVAKEEQELRLEGVETVLLEETENKLSGAIRKLLDEGKNALHGQIAIVDENEPDTVGLDKDGAVRAFTAKVTESWASKRESLIWGGRNPHRDFADKHSRLFEKTRTRIDEKVTHFYEPPRTKTGAETGKGPEKGGRGKRGEQPNVGSDSGGLGSRGLDCEPFRDTIKALRDSISVMQGRMFVITSWLPWILFVVTLVGLVVFVVYAYKRW